MACLNWVKGDDGGMPDLGLRELYERHAVHVHRRALYLLRDEADAWDATQEVFLKAHGGLARFEGRSSPLTWLLRITTHHCLNRLRAQKVRVGQGQIDAAHLDGERGLVAGSRGERSDRAVLLRGVLERFDAETQAMAVFHYVDEMTKEEVATQVGRSVPTVRKRLRHFVARARALLSPPPTSQRSIP